MSEGSAGIDLRPTPAEESFRAELRTWLDQHLVGEYAAFGRGTDFGDDGWELRVAWERELARGGWTGLRWPREWGGRGLSIVEEVIFQEEYARVGAPARAGFIGEGLIGPTIVALGTDEQKRRFLPGILEVEEFWCQGYSEPDAGSDLASLRTRAELDGDEWVVHGQKVWTSLAHRADWCFLLARTDPESTRHRGITYLLLPMRQPGVLIRPLRQITGSSEFSEVFFEGARTARENVIGRVHEGWKVAMATLGFERGTALLSQQLRFALELQALFDEARANGATRDPIVRAKLARAFEELQLIRYNSLRVLSGLARRGTVGPEASIGKLQWSTWHQRMTNLGMNLRGAAGLLLDGEGSYGLDELQRAFLFTRSSTIYAGSSEVQRNIIAEQVLALPREPKTP